MKAFLECVPCIVSQIVRILNRHEPDPGKREDILQKVLHYFSTQDILAHSPPSLTQGAHDILRQQLKEPDLYIEDKINCNHWAIEIFPIAEELYATAEDSLEVAVKLAISGNLIDYGALNDFDVNHILEDYVHRHFAIDDMSNLKKDLEEANHILYIGDNAGEIVLDKILVKHLIDAGKTVTFAVKSAPILNDALMQDAIDVGMTKLVPVIGSGSSTAGTLISQSTPEFTLELQRADMIISKGQGNFETLSEDTFKQPIYFLLLCKCPHIAKAMKINKFDLMLISLDRYKEFFNATTLI